MIKINIKGILNFWKSLMNFYIFCEDERKNETSLGWMGKERNGVVVRVSVRSEGLCWF